MKTKQLPIQYLLILSLAISSFQNLVAKEVSSPSTKRDEILAQYESEGNVSVVNDRHIRGYQQQVAIQYFEKPKFESNQFQSVTADKVYKEGRITSAAKNSPGDSTDPFQSIIPHLHKEYPNLDISEILEKSKGALEMKAKALGYRNGSTKISFILNIYKKKLNDPMKLNVEPSLNIYQDPQTKEVHLEEQANLEVDPETGSWNFQCYRNPGTRYDFFRVKSEAPQLSSDTAKSDTPLPQTPKTKQVAPQGNDKAKGTAQGNGKGAT